jgi:hypothetical protein
MRAKECILGRPVFMAPSENYQLLMNTIYYPNKLTKLLYKLGVDTNQVIEQTRETFSRMKESKQQAKQKMLHVRSRLKEKLQSKRIMSKL